MSSRQTQRLRAQIANLAKKIDGAWQKRGRNIAAFTDAAVQALEQAGPIDPEALAAWTLSTSDFPEECNPFGDAGPPAFTVFRDERFVLNLYLYATPDLFIHDHGFAGAFVNLAGDSLHCAFDFKIDQEPGPGVLSGALQLGKVELLRPGMVHPLVPGPASIHRVWHLGRPTIVLVARTLAGPRGLIQYQYDSPGLATRIVRPPPYGPEIPLAHKKRSKMFEFLLQTQPAAADGYLRKMILAGDAWSAVAHVLNEWDYLEQRRLLPSTLEELRRKYGDWVEVLPAVSRGKAVHRSIEWGALLEEGPRLLLALLLTYSEKQPIADWIAKLHPQREVDETILGWLRSAWKSEALETALDESGVAVLRVMLRGHKGKGLITELRKSFAIPAGGERQVLAVATRIKNIPFLQPLTKATSG